MKRFFFYFFISLFFYLFISSFITPSVRACSYDRFGNCTGACASGFSCEPQGYQDCGCKPDPTDEPQPTDEPGIDDQCTGNPNNPDCTAPVCCGPPEFGVCNRSNPIKWVWTCTDGTTGCSSWSDWSPAQCTAPDVQTRYCTEPNINDAEAQTCPVGGGDPTPTPGGPPINMYNCRTNVDPDPNHAYTCLATSGTYENSAAGINSCQSNLAIYVVNPPYPTPGGVAMSTGVCSNTQAACQAGCCRPVYWCQDNGVCTSTNHNYYSNDGPGNPGYLDCNNGYATTCTQNLQNLETPPNNLSCYSTLASCQASCVAVNPPTCNISASPASINYGSSSTISWSSTNATSCSIASPGWTGTSGSQNTGSLTSTRTYTESCTGAGGSCTDSATVTVSAPPSTPVGSCGSFNDLTCTTPVTWTWASGTGLQATFDYAPETNPLAQYWLFNSAATSPWTFNSILTGHIAYARTTYNYSYFSGTASRTCTIPTLSAPTLTCGSFNATGVYTPVTATWANGTALQVTRDYAPETLPASQYWMYNDTASSGIIITPPAGKYMPPGDTIYARTYYECNGATFSATSNILCPTPTNPPPVTISGPLQQKSGTGCYPATDTSNFNAQNPTVTTNPSSCVATACTVSPFTSAAQTYTCITTFSNQNCLDDNPPTWPTSATLTLTGIAPSGYTFVGWTPNGSCTPATNSKTVNAGDTDASQPITFIFSGSNWLKLKNSSYNGISITGITVPAFVNSYDADDDATKYFIIGNAGVVLNTTVSPSTGYSSPNNWYASSYTKSSLMNPTTYLSYVKSRKEYQTVSDMSSINQDGIYVWNGALTLNNANLNQATASKFILIVDGNVTIDQDKFNIGSCTDATGLKKIAILSKTGTITFSTSTQCAAGVFIAQTVDTGSITSQGLKIKGNLIAQTTLTNGRAWSDTSRPGLFVVFDPVQYINLLPYLSTASYDWRQIQ